MGRDMHIHLAIVYAGLLKSAYKRMYGINVWLGRKDESFDT